jgi:hypothetical protein
MKLTILLVPLLLVFVVMVSGCTFSPGDIFGKDVISVQTRVVEEAGKDPVVIKEITTNPTGVILPDNELSLFFVIENTNKVYTVNNVRVDLFNAPGFRNQEGTAMCNSEANVCLPVDGECSPTNPCTLLPGEQRLVQYVIRSPTKSQISSIKTQAELSFKVLYDFSSSMNFVIPAVNKEEVLKRMREGETLDMKFDKSYSSGPVRLDVETVGVNYLLDDYETVLLFSLRNVGSGNLQVSQIPEFNLNQPIPNTDKTSEQGIEISFPPQLSVNLQNGDSASALFGSPYFKSENFVGSDMESVDSYSLYSYRNLKPIPLYREQSQISIRFPIKLKQDIYQNMVDNQIPFRSYEIKTTAYYTYELRSSIDVTINPFENV